MARTLNLGAGNKIMPGVVNHDRIAHRPEIDVAWDLDVLPWPWPDNSFDLIIASSVLEHLHIDLLASINECWRILDKGGRLWVKVPHWNNESAYNDPTHQRVCGLAVLDAFDPTTRGGQAYSFYTPRKWRIIRKLRAVKNGTSIVATMEVIK